MSLRVWQAVAELTGDGVPQADHRTAGRQGGQHCGGCGPLHGELQVKEKEARDFYIKLWGLLVTSRTRQRKAKMKKKPPVVERPSAGYDLRQEPSVRSVHIIVLTQKEKS